MEGTGTNKIKNVALFLAILVIISMAVRFSLFRFHQIIEGDGVHYAALARLISREGNFLGAANEYWSNLWPVVIAFFDLFFHNLDFSGRLASTIFGSLTVIPAYLLTREIFDKRTGLVAAALVIGHPYLLKFSAFLFTESFFTFIFAITIWLGIRLIKSPKNRKIWLSLSIVIGFGFLIRPEIQIVALAFPLLAIFNGLRQRISLRPIIGGFLIFIVFVFASLSLRAILIWSYHHEWHFGYAKKMTINLTEGEIFYNSNEHEKFHNKFENGQFVNKKPEQIKILPYLWKNRNTLIHRININMKHIIQSYYAVLPAAKGHPAMHIISAILAALGIFWALLRKQYRWLALLLLFILVIYSIPWTLIFVVDRFVVPLTIIAIVFTASGLIALETAITYPIRLSKFTKWPILPFIFIIAFSMKSATWARHVRLYDPVSFKEAGLYLKANFPQKMRILTWGPHVPYYFYDGNPYSRSIQNIPWAPYKDFMAYVHKKNINLIAIPEWVLKDADFPIKNLISENTKHDGLEFISIIGKEQPLRVWIYKVLKKNENMTSPSR